VRRIVWTDEAVAHLEAIAEYVEAFNPPAALRLGRRMIEVADSSANLPSADAKRAPACAR
jgi:plasmid stabilization system protein ParE